MSNEDNDLPVQDELAALKQRADMLGVSYHPSIGLEKLREKVNKAVTSEGPVEPEADSDEDGDKEDDDSNNDQTPPPAPPPAAPSVAAAPVRAETPAEKKRRLMKEAGQLVRIRVTCMNPNKKEWEGEIFTAGNGLVGTFKKFVPFNSDEGWHVPKIIYNQIKRRECPVFVTKKDGRGNKVRQGKLIKEFAVEVLPQLSPQELKELAQRQAMAKGQD